MGVSFFRPWMSVNRGGWELQTLLTKVSLTTFNSRFISVVLRAYGLRSNGSGATHHQTENPIIAQRANTNRMSLQYEYTIASDSLKVLIREVSRFISEKPILLSGERRRGVLSLTSAIWKGSCPRFAK